MKRITYIAFLPLLLLLTGCSGVKSSWNDFQAHYNTYYNAENSFEKGLRGVESQPVEINPEKPVRVHYRPDAVSKSDFQSAIDKSARILRKFPESKWTDDALFLIGKSYYYLGDFHLAIDKFEELKALTDAPQLKAASTIWKGRTLLELEHFSEGITFLLKEFDAGYWTPSARAEAEVLLGEYYASRANWEQASSFLADALNDLPGSRLKGRTFFLYGQVLEEQGRYGEAIFAYEQVRAYHPDYEYIYWSEMKRGEIATEEGHLDLALDLYRDMSRDDKNYLRRGQIRYRIGRVHELKGNTEQAEKIYNRLLRSDSSPSSRELQGRIYYRLGKIYSEQYDNFSTAAAYFDSSSARASQSSLWAGGQNARSLASAYKTYTGLREKISRLDSLLWLGSLPPAKLDSVLDELRERKRRAINRRLQEDESEKKRLVNLGNAAGDEQTRNSTVYGFLNYRNARLARESANEFRVVWGDRPLVDNWRRIEVVRSTAAADGSLNDADNGGARPSEADKQPAELNLDLSDIPTTPRRQREYREKLAVAHYELGNLFFLTLQEPDSAEVYFNKVVREYPDSPLAPRAMYSFFEMHTDQGNGKGADYWSNRILREHAETRYADKILQRRGRAATDSVPADSTRFIRQRLQEIEGMPDSLAVERAERYRAVALENRGSGLAPFVYFRAIREYLELARTSTDSSAYRRLIQAGSTGAGQPQSTAPDSAAEDTLGLSPFAARDLEPGNVTRGAYWDSVRTLIRRYEELFPAAAETPRVRAISELLAAGSGNRADPEVSYTCEELGVSPDISGGMEQFLSTIRYPEDMQFPESGSSLTYRFIIHEDGGVVSFSRVSVPAVRGLAMAYEKAFRETLRFNPIRVNSAPVKVSCRLTLPIPDNIKK